MRMEKFWTSKKSINGLRHFILLNEYIEKGEIICLMVSVLDAEINLKIPQKELLKKINWDKGWLSLPKIESVTEDYLRFKSVNKSEEIK